MKKISPMKVLTTGEAAKHCGVHFRTVLRWIQQGRLRAFQLPGRGDHRIQVEDFMEFLQSHGMPIPPEFRDRTRQAIVIDDDPVASRRVEKILDDLGFQVHTAGVAFEAGAKLRSLTPVLVVLDPSLPGLPGAEAIEFIRSDDRLRSARVLVLGSLSKKEQATLLEGGADAVLAKDVAVEEIGRELDALFQGSSVRLDRPRA